MYGRCNTARYGPAYERRGHHFGRGFGSQFRRPKYNVPINIDEKEDQFIVSVYATGFGKENIKLSVHDDTLYISGTRTFDENDKPKQTGKHSFQIVKWSGSN